MVVVDLTWNGCTGFCRVLSVVKYYFLILVFSAVACTGRV